MYWPTIVFTPATDFTISGTPHCWYIGLTSSNYGLVLDRYTLWRARGSGSIHYTAEIFTIWGNRIDHVAFTECPKLFKAHDGQALMRGLELVDMLLLHVSIAVVDHCLELGCGSKGFQEGRQELRITVDGFGACLHQRMFYALLAKGIVSGGDSEGL